MTLEEKLHAREVEELHHCREFTPLVNPWPEPDCETGRKVSKLDYDEPEGEVDNQAINGSLKADKRNL